MPDRTEGFPEATVALENLKAKVPNIQYLKEDVSTIKPNYHYMCVDVRDETKTK